MTRRKHATLVAWALGFTGLALVVGVAALAGAQPKGDAGGAWTETASPAQQALRAVEALTAAHPGDRAVSFLAETAHRELGRLPSDRQQALQPSFERFSRAAEEHLIRGDRSSTAAQQLLGQLIQEVRGTQGGGSSTPVSPPAENAKLSAFGRDLTVEEHATVDEAVVVGGNLTVRGHVLGDAVALGGNVQLAPGARVDGDVVSLGGHIQAADNAWVAGDRTQLGAGTFSGIAPLAGTLPHHEGGLFLWLTSLVKKVGFGLVLTLFGLVISALAPNRVRTVITTLRQRPVLSLVSGLLAQVVTATAMLLLIVTLVGIPLVPLLLVMGFLAVMMGLTAVACLLGEALPGSQRHVRSGLRCLVLGMALLTLLSLLPLGWLFLGFLATASLGAVVLSRVGASAPTS